jgi:hypothetical protein
MACLFEQAQVVVGSSAYIVLIYALTSSKSGQDVGVISYKEDGYANLYCTH